MQSKPKYYRPVKSKKPPMPVEPVDRPPIYPHAPRHQEDYIDSLISQKDFDPVKSSKFEGAINLGCIVLVVLVSKYTYLSLYENGYLLLKDLNIVQCIIYELLYMLLCDLLEGSMTIGTYCLYQMFLKAYLTRWGLLCAHYIYLFFFGGISLYIQWNMPPLYALISSMLLVAYMMKMHSYIATNILLHSGVNKKYEEIMGPKKSTYENSNKQQVPTFYNSANTNTTPSESPVKNTHIPNDPESIYPFNVTLKNYIYYIYCAPSLIYETKFLRTTEFRWLYLLKESVAFLFCCISFASILSQFILPVLITKEEESVYQVISDLFKVTVPSLFLWLLGFYAYFHCWLNIRSELVGFANREFYKDWWNADSIGAFWRKWNLPMHEWVLRHVYIESIYYFNASKDIASSMVFLISTIMHEFYLCIGFKAYHPFFLLVSIGQLPLIYLNRKIKNSKRVGNTIMWLSLMIGQPLLEILYFRSWMMSKDFNNINFWCRY